MGLLSFSLLVLSSSSSPIVPSSLGLWVGGSHYYVVVAAVAAATPKMSHEFPLNKRTSASASSSLPALSAAARACKIRSNTSSM